MDNQVKKYLFSLRRVFVNLICSLAGLFFKRNVILFESYPELDGSPWMIYRELIKRGYEKKYKMVWAVDAGYEAPVNINCVPFFGKMPFLQRFRYLFYAASAKVIIENSRFIKKRNFRTFRLHTQHGAPLKKCFSYTSLIGNVDAILSLSENTVSVESNLFNTDEKKFLTLGYPTNDRLFENVDLYKIGFWETISKNKEQFKKIIGWLPTYRQHRNGSDLNSSYVFPFGIPLFSKQDDFEKVNLILKEKNILLAVQMHHVQAKNFPEKNYSNILIISPEVKREFNVSTANLMHCFDALITDYSGAYHEYLLLDRPIALCIDDYEEYSKNPGFSIDYFDWIKGVYLRNISDLIHFVNEISEGVDSAKVERESSMLRFHKFFDNQSTSRVVDFLEKSAKL